MGKDVGHTAKLSKGGNTDGGAEVINEDKEGGPRGLEDAVVSNAVEDGSHRVLADSEVQVLARVGLVEAGTEVSAVVDVVTGGAVEIRRPRDVVGYKLGNLLDDLEATDTGGLSITAHLRDGLDHLTSRHDVVGDRILKLLGHVRVGLLPGSVRGLPLIINLSILLLDTREEVTSSLRNIPLLLRKANAGTGLVDVGDTSLSVSSVGTLSLFHALSDDGVALDELGLAIVGGLGSSDGLLNNSKVVAVNFVGLKSVGFVTLDDILGLSVFGHLVKGDLVGVVEDNQVVKLLLRREAGGLRRDSLLEAAITSKGEDVVVKDRVVISVVFRGGHLFRNGESDGVGNTSSQGTSGALNSRGGVLRVGEFRVAGSLGVVLTEVLQLLNGEVEPSKVQPGIKEHGSVAGGEDEAVTVHPLGILRVVLHLGSVENGSNFSASKRKTHVAGVSGGDGVHGKTTGLVGGRGESGHLVNLSGGLRHLKGGGLANAPKSTGGSGGESLNTSSDSRSGNNKRGELHGAI
mmetsp:Transcript_31839/g.67832  ORF Transcript_31839/g.67832 Transcript_31839/m.67832 type:complete len:518 (+) Transcript_31839:724-2277(+)